MSGRAMWRAAGCSIRGASHARRNQPNQDAMGWLPACGYGTRVMVAIADGHGSSSCPESAAGAAIAVRCALRAFDETNPAGALLGRWREEVDRQISRASLTRRAYGTTALAVHADGDTLEFLQIGDGDILLVGDNGDVVRPLRRSSSSIGNETESLCSHDAHVQHTKWSGLQPALVVLSTDGYANAFRTDEGFLRVGTDLYQLIREHGVDRVAAGLGGWLLEASQSGSGDDVTVALLIGPSLAGKEADGARAGSD